jgi:uncharacterized membrane protein YphA (DoxX/SURF4 family)
LGISFLSAVADRFGLWGGYGQPNVAWGEFSRFVAYTGKVNWFAPSTMIPALAWAATCAELLLGLALVLGFFTRVAAFLSGLLLFSFALTMTFGLAIKAALDLSLFSTAAHINALDISSTWALAPQSELPGGICSHRIPTRPRICIYQASSTQANPERKPP